MHFRVWAPRRSRVEVVFASNPDRGLDGDRPEAIPLEPEPGGFFSGFVAAAKTGTWYHYRLDGGEMFPDPASRFQPCGPHGPSEVIDPGGYRWHDRSWPGLDPADLVLYELHIGTFTAEGTWSAAEDRLSALAELGVNAIELMPVAEFPGAFGWGYDGVDLFAPYHHYGTPNAFRRFVDRAHSLGLGVLLDVVYNHFGPDGAYHRQFADAYFHAVRSGNEWGDALNFDGPDSGPVRDFFAANAAYWIDEFHLDGLRLDATQAIHDESDEPILAVISRRARAAAGGRRIVLIAENEPQDVRLIQPIAEGGLGLDAIWNDDFHHAAAVALTGRAEAYYCDYQGTPQELISAVKWGFLFQGQFTKWQQKRRGTRAFGIEPWRFVTFLESHDQVANSSRSSRLRVLADPGSYRALTALWLLAPQTPMLFQGQEWGAERPFFYFGDHRPEVAGPMREGRFGFLRQFASVTNPEVAACLPDPAAESTFLASKLDEPDPGAPDRQRIHCLFHDLLQLRRGDRTFHDRRAVRIHGAVLGPEALALRWFGDNPDEDRVVVTNLGRDLYPAPATEPLIAPPPGRAWSVLWSSESPEYGGLGIPPLDATGVWRISGHATIVLKPVPDTTEPAGADSVLIGEVQEIHPDVLARSRGSQTSRSQTDAS